MPPKNEKELNCGKSNFRFLKGLFCSVVEGLDGEFIWSLSCKCIHITYFHVWICQRWEKNNSILLTHYFFGICFTSKTYIASISWSPLKEPRGLRRERFSDDHRFKSVSGSSCTAEDTVPWFPQLLFSIVCVLGTATRSHFLSFPVGHHLPPHCPPPPHSRCTGSYSGWC